MKFKYPVFLMALTLLMYVYQVNFEIQEIDTTPKKNPSENPNGFVFYPVTKIVDGDTFWIDDQSPKGRKIRLIGVDAPESRSHLLIIAYFFIY